MTDRRRHAESKDLKKAILELLNSKPKQAYELRLALKKKNEKFSYSRDRLNDILNQMIGEGDIERILLNKKPYPVYQVLSTSKILAELNGFTFRAFFEKGMFQNCGELLDEFELSKHEKNKADAILQFFGFMVFGSLIASHMYDKPQRSIWLRVVLDLERENAMSYFLDELVDEEVLKEIIRLFIKNYNKNIRILVKAIEASKDIKQLTESSPGASKIIKLFIDRRVNNQ